MTKVLHVTQMQEGDYTFQLVVTDTSGQKATAKINIIVQPVSFSSNKKVNLKRKHALVYFKISCTCYG